MHALMKSPTGNGVPRILNPRYEKSGFPTTAAISGVSKSLVSAVTIPPNAAPITTPTAISTTFPRRINFLNPSSMKGLLEKQEERVDSAQPIVNHCLHRYFVILSNAKDPCICWRHHGRRKLH